MLLNELGELILLWGVPPNQEMDEIKKKVQATRGASVLVPEMRPHLLGSVIAKKLQREKIKHVYVTDNMLGILFYKQKIKEVLFFYKERKDHHWWGINGSLYVCLLAHMHKVPIQPLQGGTVIRAAEISLSLDDYMCFHYNDVIKAEGEAVPDEVMQ
jgi:hypothetical protein